MKTAEEFIQQVKKCYPIIEGVKALHDGTVDHKEGFTGEDFTLALILWIASDGRLEGKRVSMELLGEYAGAAVALAAHLEKQRTPGP